MRHQNLTITVRTTANAEGEHPRANTADFSSHRWGHQLQDTGKGAGFFQGKGVVQQALTARLVPTFDAVLAALFHHMLGQHAEMTHEGNSFGQDRLNLRQDLLPSLGLHIFSTRLNQAAGIADRLGRRLIGFVR